MSDFNIEHVHCCVCDGSGKKRQGFFHRLKDCPVCDGKGERPIMIHKALSPPDADMVRQSAILGSANYISPSIINQVIGSFGRW